MRSSQKVNIRVVLEGELASKFLELKKTRGLLSSCELIRQLIMEAMKREREVEAR